MAPNCKRYSSIPAALQAARAFRRDYGSRGYVYQACPCLYGPGYFVAVYSAPHGVPNLYLIERETRPND